MKVKGVIIQWLSDEDEATLKPEDWPEGMPTRSYIRFDVPVEWDEINTPGKLDERMRKTAWDDDPSIEQDWEEVGHEWSGDRDLDRHTVGMDATLGDFTSPGRDITLYPVTEDQQPVLAWIVK